jgi:hypothetical protein
MTDPSYPLPLALALVQFDQFLNGRCILRLFVSLPERDQPRKAQRIAWLCSRFSRGMGGRARDLVGQYLDDELLLDPHARLDQRGDAGWPVIDFQFPGALPDTAPLLITQPRADFGHRDEQISLGIIQPHQQGTRPERRALATAIEVAQQDAVEGIIQGSSRVPLELHLVEISRAGFVAALSLFHHQDFQSLADGVIKEEHERVGIPHGVAGGEHEGVGRLVHALRENLQAFHQRGIQQRCPVFLKDVKGEGLQRELLGQSLDLVLAPPAGRFLKGQEFLGGGVVGQGLRVQNGALCPYPNWT